MTRTLTTLAMIAFLLVPETLGAEQRPIVAVFNVEKSKKIELDKDTLSELANYLATRITESGTYQVVPRDQIKQRLFAEKKRSHKDCYDQSCQIEIGKELAAEKTLSTRVMKLGKRCTVTLTLYDLKKAATESAASHHGKCSEDDIVNSLDIAVSRLLNLEGSFKKATKKERNSQDNSECRDGIDSGTIKKGFSYRKVIGKLGKPDKKEHEDGVLRKIVYHCPYYLPEPDNPDPKGCRIYFSKAKRVTVCFGCDICWEHGE